MKKFIYLLGACIILGSCSTGEAAVSSMLGGSSQAPLFLNCRTVSEFEIEFEFSQPVKVSSLSFDPFLAVASVEEGSTIRVILEESAEPGMIITADLLAEDERRNTINVLVPFRARNNRMPALQINEIRTEYSKPNVEFIELKMKTAGNLGAMRIFMAGGSQKPTIYEFSPVEVKKDEYVVIHLRKLDENNMDEYGDNLSESGGAGSSSGGRDFWFPGTAKLINKTGVVYVMDQDDNVIDAVMFSEKQEAWWAKDYLAEAAEFLHSQGAWKTADGNICGPADAVRSSGSAPTRTICRDETLPEDTNTAAEWYIAYTSNATPGKLNSERRWQ
jgi:hypothetical protein